MDRSAATESPFADRPNFSAAAAAWPNPAVTFAAAATVGRIAASAADPAPRVLPTTDRSGPESLSSSVRATETAKLLIFRLSVALAF